MSTVLALAVTAAALACPLHMLWRLRRGQRGACVPPGRRVDELADCQAQLADDVARLARDRG